MTNKELIQEAIKNVNDFADRQSPASFESGHAMNATRSLYTILEEIMDLEDHAADEWDRLHMIE